MTRLWRGGLKAETESDGTAAQNTLYIKNIFHTKTDIPKI